MPPASARGNVVPGTYPYAVDRRINILMHPFRVEAEALSEPNTRGVALVAGWPRGQLAPLASAMTNAGLGAWSLELLTHSEGSMVTETGQSRFALEILAGRILVAADWAATHLPGAASGLTVVGVGPAGPAALIAASERGTGVRAVVAAARRPDLAGAGALKTVRAAALLLFDESDAEAAEAAARSSMLMGAAARATAVHGLSDFGVQAAKVVGSMTASWVAQHLSGVVDRPAPGA